MRDAIRALSPKLRDALLLAQAGDYSYEEIGAMLGAPLGTIKWRVSEARRVVRKHLQERGLRRCGMNAVERQRSTRSRAQMTAATPAGRRRRSAAGAGADRVGDAPRARWRAAFVLVADRRRGRRS